MTFNTKVKVELTADALLGDSIEKVEDVTIAWEIFFVQKDWGIEGYRITVPHQILTVKGEHFKLGIDGEYEDAPTEFCLTVDLNRCEAYFQFDKDDVIYPEILTLEYNHDNKSWRGTLE